MKIRELKKHFSRNTKVSRGAHRREVVVECGKGGPLEYRADERAFEDETEMADYLKSKLPMAAVPLQL